MEHEPLYKVRAWLAIVELRALSALVEGEKKACSLVWGEERLWGGFYRCSGLYGEGNKPSTAMVVIHRRSKRCTQRLGASRAMGGAAAPLAPPLGLIFCPGALACMLILGMLVLDFYSLESVSHSPKCTWSWWIKRIFILQISHDFVLMSEYTCDQQKSSKMEQDSWVV